MTDVTMTFYAVVNTDEEPTSLADLKKSTVYSGSEEQCQRFVRLYPTRRLYIKEIEFVIRNVELVTNPPESERGKEE